MMGPTHLLVGMSVGFLCYGIRSWQKKKDMTFPDSVSGSSAGSGGPVIARSDYDPGIARTILIAGLSAVAPDIDWFFGHYGSVDPMLGHRGMTHSFFGVLVLASIIASTATLATAVNAGFCNLFKKIKKSMITVSNRVRLRQVLADNFRYAFLLATIGGLSHLAGDLITPPGGWKGIPLFFPFQSDGIYVRYGGFALIGWYDLRIFFALLAANVISLLLSLPSALFKTIGQRAAFRSVMILIIIAQLSTLAYLGRHIASSRYENRRSWNRKQSEFIRRFPPAGQKAIIEGRSNFFRLLRR